MTSLPSLRTALHHKLKTEPAEHRPHIRNVITTLDIMLGKRPADEREAARKQTLRNIESLERVRSRYVACVRT